MSDDTLTVEQFYGLSGFEPSLQLVEALCNAQLAEGDGMHDMMIGLIWCPHLQMRVDLDAVVPNED